MTYLEGGMRCRGILKNSSKSQPLVSIITVVKNSAKELKRTIQTTLKQNYPNIEYIVLDGGSCDKSIDIIKQFDNELDIWISEKDQGIYDAMNKGIILSHGSIVGFINAGDWYCKDALSVVVDEFISDHRTQVVFGDVALCDRNLNGLYVATVDKRKFNDGWLPHPAVFAKKEVYDQFGYFDIKLRISADYDFMLRINGRTTKKHIKQPLVNMIIGGISTNQFFTKAKEDYFARKKNGIPFQRNLLLTILGIISPVLNGIFRSLSGRQDFRFESISIPLFIQKINQFSNIKIGNKQLHFNKKRN
jgi:glycosyltransferase involved in cell wall biosynthesis|tara:strand:+ start:1793 stop:2704 length:912 start_codon:yes stop_codon:yes gene_type:complete